MSKILQYRAYEEEVYNWLMAKHKSNPEFTFSLRQKGSKGAELDYFIGTSKSSYFGTTFWTLPVAFPGSSSDCINLIFKISDSGYSYFFEFTQTKSPHDDQNAFALQFIQSLEEELEKRIGLNYVTSEDQKMYSSKTKSSSKFYDSISKMLLDIDGDLKIILDLVDEKLASFKVNNPSFVMHRITKEEFDSMLERKDKRFLKYEDVNSDMNFEESDSNIDFNELISKMNAADLENYFTYLRKLLSFLGIKNSDKRIVFSVRDNQLNFIIGQRYCWNLFASDAKGKYGVISNQRINESSSQFSGKEPNPFYTQFDSFDIAEMNFDNVASQLSIELERSNKSSFRKWNNVDFENKLFNIMTNESIGNKYKAPLNQILYGPPGTGKTYKLQNEYFDKFSINESTLTKEQYLENLVSDLNWWQVISIAVLDLKTSKVNTIHEHEIVKAKEKISDSKTVRPTIWGQLQRHTVLDCQFVNVKDRSEPLYFNKDENSNWTIDSELLSQYYPEAFDILNGIKNFKGNAGISIKNYEFITFHQSFSYEDFIEGIKPKLDEGEADLNFEIKDGIFKKLCLKAEADLENDYAIFIDEINRGNVSAIFGELITLIEPDKRIGAINELKVKLPYSKKEFGVPKNLHIIGTMNTADRSVEALDTALRRRFSFTEMMPDEKVFDELTFSDNYARKDLMLKINHRVEVLLDRNYTLGHSYFIKKDFKNSFKNEIIPLLQEYFYNDYGKIGLVLGEGFVREKEITKNANTSIFADFDTKNEIEIVKSYELIPFDDVGFDIALETLLA
ncbi:McrB family protein [Flavobacterium sp.]|jgi:5-methylcytosine-specific restriction protein B|uniref:McrB family protein n=1 Tax=Flavobacterium sp. TaxID=239 RepID=UPI002A836A7D|nr:AAA family ATPase [Flavobacterium sp.]